MRRVRSFSVEVRKRFDAVRTKSIELFVTEYVFCVCSHEPSSVLSLASFLRSFVPSFVAFAVDSLRSLARSIAIRLLPSLRLSIASFFLTNSFVESGGVHRRRCVG